MKPSSSMPMNPLREAESRMVGLSSSVPSTATTFTHAALVVMLR